MSIREGIHGVSVYISNYLGTIIRNRRDIETEKESTWCASKLTMYIQNLAELSKFT